MSASAVSSQQASRPPLWLILATAALAGVILLLAVVETSIKAAYLIDEEGEFLSLFGLAFILVAGLLLWRQRRLYTSLPLVLPWLLYPVVTQGDQIIDYLSINAMRVIVHLLLAPIFATPVWVVTLLARRALAPAPGRTPTPAAWMSWVPGFRLMAEGRLRQGSALFATALLALEAWLANEYAGTLMIVTLIIMIFGTLIYGSQPEPDAAQVEAARPRSERMALMMLVGGVALSLGLYFGYKNRPGAYQGSPSFLMDPAMKAANYRFDRLALPAGVPTAPAGPVVGEVLGLYAQAFERLFQAYHILNRNYTWDYHNELFLRSTPLVENYRAVGLDLVKAAAGLHAQARARAAEARSGVGAGDPLLGLLDEIEAYAAFQFGRSPVLEEMSRGFDTTKAGLQHSAHLYEGETKYLGMGLDELLRKYRPILDAPALAPVAVEFVRTSERIYNAYADRVVGY